MLEGLDDVDWENLEHAYGSAADVPNLIRELLSEDAEVRESAIWELYGNIYHQGTVYEATSYAVPFLIEIAAEPSTPDRAQVLKYLIELSQGSSFLDVHQHLEFAGREMQKDPDFEAKLAKELLDVRRVMEALGVGWPTYLQLVQEDSDAAVRAFAAWLLHLGREHYGDFGGQLQSCLQSEADDLAAASILMSLAALEPAAYETELIKVLEDESPWKRLSGALGYSRFVETAIPEEVQDVLFEFLTHPEQIDVSACPWIDDVGSDIGAVLTRLQGENRQRCARLLLDALKAQKVYYDSIDYLLELTFGHLEEPPPILVALTEFQREALEFVARVTYSKSGGSWVISSNYTYALGHYGLDDLAQEIVGYS